MADFVKKKIVEKLARFTKHLKPSDISLSFLTGKGHLSNLELDGEFISSALQLPPWLVVSRVVCDTIRARVPFTTINTDPVNFYIGQVLVEISTSTQTTTTATDASSLKLLKQFGGTPSKYSLIDKVVDGMRIEIRSVLVFLKDPLFHAQLEIMDILIQSTSWEWQVVPLNKSRVRIDDEDSVINYKVCSWSSLKIEGWSTATDDVASHNQLRLIAGPSKIYITFKRSVSDSSIMCSRIVVALGDLIWILTQSQLRAVSRLMQSLMDAAVRTHKEQAEQEDSDSEGSIDSVSSERGTQKTGNQQQQKKKRKSKSSSRRDKGVKERIAQYQDGKLNLPSYEVIQNTFHFKTGKMDLQFCDDTSNSGGVTDTVQGSMLFQIHELVVDVYLDQPAGVGRAHWNKANEIIDKNTRWSKKLITMASKTQLLDLPSVNLPFLHERGVVIRCSDFSVGALKKGLQHSVRDENSLPIIASDKVTFNIPNDVHNPALQVGVSLYFYPDKYGDKFLVPRPNVFVYVSPVHVNVHQESCLWLVEFIHGVVKTVNIELALSVKDEGKSFLEDMKSQSIEVKKLPGIDIKFKVLFTKVTLPLPSPADDGRPKALQIETAAIKAKNSPLHKLMDSSHFQSALKAIKDGWIFSSQDNPQFPHYQDDLRVLPTQLQKLLLQQIRIGRKRGESCSQNSSTNSNSTGLAPEENHSEMVAIESWHVSTTCVHVAFTNSCTHQGTLRADTFVDDFPFHIWVFLPSSPLDSTHIPRSNMQKEPKFSILAHTPFQIKVELERLQLLFLMRLKDSFNAFKSSLMKFLDPDTFAPHLKETLEAHRVAAGNAEPATPPVTISGCFAVSCLEASILLPTLWQPKSSASSPTNTSMDPNLDPTSDREDLHTSVGTSDPSPSPVLSPTTSPTHSMTSLTTSSYSTATRALVSPSPSQVSQTRLTSSPSSSQVSLTRLTGSPSPSGSLASLPMILETGGDDPLSHSKTTFVSTSNLPNGQTSSHTLPSRAHSAVELHPQPEALVLAESNSARDKSSSEEGFVIVNCPAMPVPHPSPKPHPPPSPVVHVQMCPTDEQSCVPVTPEVPSLLPLPTPLSPDSVSSRTLSSKSTSTRRLKSPPPSRLERPQFVLHAQIQHIFALPNIREGEISIRLSADTVSLRELSIQEYHGMKELDKKKSKDLTMPPPNPCPSIKARMEVGKQVKRFYPSSCEDEQDIILVAKAEGLDLTLLLPNITVLKDFFDDEYEALLPLPLHLKVAATRAVLMEDLAHGADHVQSVEVGIDQLELHRGRELRQELDIFLEKSADGMLRFDDPDSVSLDRSADSDLASADSDKLLHSFSSFISVFESHVQQHGRVDLPKPQHVTELLQELKTALSRPNTSPPPIYAEVAPYSSLQSSARRSSSEVLHLRRENERLRLVQRECEQMSAQLSESQVEMNRRETDLMMVTDECKRTKEQLVSYKQVMEKQQEHIEKLLTENFDLQRQLLERP